MQRANAQKPPMRPSKESDREQLELAREQGAAYQHALTTMIQDEAHGEAKVVGDYRVGYAVEEAEGMHFLRDGVLQWTEPMTENCHVEVAVSDAADGRFIPGLTVRVTLIDDQGHELGTHEQPFLWHPWLYHYGRNWRVPGDGAYRLRVHIEAPHFPRHDHINGQRYAQSVDVEFDNVRIKTGQKRS